MLKQPHRNILANNTGVGSGMEMKLTNCDTGVEVAKKNTILESDVIFELQW